MHISAWHGHDDVLHRIARDALFVKLYGRIVHKNKISHHRLQGTESPDTLRYKPVPHVRLVRMHIHQPKRARDVLKSTKRIGW